MTSTEPGPTELAAYAGTWTLDPGRTTVSFRTKAMWVMPVKGRARALEGGCRVGSDGSLEGRVVIDARSIDTGIAKRDQHLRTADFLDTEQHPTIEFDLTGARSLGDGRLTLEGDLLIRGQRQPVAFPAQVTTDGDSATLTGSIDDLDRRKWGLSWTKMGAGVHNNISVTAVFTRSQD